VRFKNGSGCAAWQGHGRVLSHSLAEKLAHPFPAREHKAIGNPNKAKKNERVHAPVDSYEKVKIQNHAGHFRPHEYPAPPSDEKGSSTEW
jgi:hypothetical protein